jgi:hypothetical protein
MGGDCPGQRGQGSEGGEDAQHTETEEGPVAVVGVVRGWYGSVGVHLEKNREWFILHIKIVPEREGVRSLNIHHSHCAVAAGDRRFGHQPRRIEQGGAAKSLASSSTSKISRCLIG